MRLLFDEDFNQRIVRGLLRRIPRLEYRSAHDDDLASKSDDEVLAVAAVENRLLVSHDVNTMTAAFRARTAAGATVPGLLLVPQQLPIGDAIAELELICRVTEPDDWAGRLEFLPL